MGVPGAMWMFLALCGCCCGCKDMAKVVCGWMGMYKDVVRIRAVAEAVKSDQYCDDKGDGMGWGEGKKGEVIRMRGSRVKQC